ncbi:hypothetical protein [Sphingomonas sp. PR090111-T3T-6A]|uniref:hypothetical protein n=1 Tax=Sphingomonas sp. PR090111-T3T-6A TaxID=685778 RepID=UPI0012F85037|nr:hypothetical protein [Sphingomonas sp. PR090111-T3T-6A]
MTQSTEKKAKFGAAPATEKKAKFGATPQPEKKARHQDPTLDDGHPLAWRFSGADRGGPFAWTIAEDDKFRQVVEKLYEFEGKNWSEITASGSHAIPVARLCKEAQDRLVDIERDDLDELMSLRLTGPNRVWCVRTGHIMRVFWWDADHKVYPTPIDKADRKKIKRRKGR